MFYRFLFFYFCCACLENSHLQIIPSNGCSITEIGGVYFVELKDGHLQKRTAIDASRPPAEPPAQTTGKSFAVFVLRPFFPQPAPMCSA